MGKVQATFAFVKPDAVKRGLSGEVIRRIEGTGLKIVALKMISLSRAQARRLYAVHREKPFYEDLVDFVTSGPLVAMIVKGNEAIKAVRDLIGATNPKEARPGTIRADFGTDVMRNVVHASDSRQSFEHEYPIIFKLDEIIGGTSAPSSCARSAQRKRRTLSR